jgi:hypothetical protein
MRRAGVTETARRVATLLLSTAALVLGVRFGLGAALILAAAAGAAYVLIPREIQPEGALVFERMPAVIGPDILGFLLGAFFLGLPLAAAVFEGDPLGTIHPSALLAWPMAIFGLAILAIAATHASYRVVIEAEGLRIADPWGERLLPFTAITRVEPYRRGLPAFVRRLVPLLVATGRYTQAGAVMLARDSTGIRLVCDDAARSEVVTAEGFERPFRRIVAALEKHGVPFSAV